MPPRHALRGGVVSEVEAEVLHGGEGEGGDRLDALTWSGLGLRVRVRVRARAWVWVRVKVRVRVRVQVVGWGNGMVGVGAGAGVGGDARAVGHDVVAHDASLPV